MTQLYIYREIRSPADHHILQTDIQKLTDWSNKWQMNFNTSKCHLVTITHKPKPSEFTYTIANQPISRVNSHPYLGVTIDAKLSWTKHIQSTASKSAKTLWATQTNPISRQTKSKGGSLQHASETEIRIWRHGAIAWNPHTTGGSRGGGCRGCNPPLIFKKEGSPAWPL